MARRKDEAVALGTGVVVVPAKKRKLRRPRRWKVILHNDDFTTMDFVVGILMSIFHKSQPEAVEIMLNVHQKGAGVAGIYTREVAESKVRKVEAVARQAEFPLLCTAEPVDEESGDAGGA